jgi:hypothetical protein
LTNTTDALVFIPLIPALPVLATWFLPWERWNPSRVPNSIIGPYLLYCAFAAWYFKTPWWFVVGVSLRAIIVCVIAVFEKKNQPNS